MGWRKTFGFMQEWKERLLETAHKEISVGRGHVEGTALLTNMILAWGISVIHHPLASSWAFVSCSFTFSCWQHSAEPLHILPREEAENMTSHNASLQTSELWIVVWSWHHHIWQALKLWLHLHLQIMLEYSSYDSTHCWCVKQTLSVSEIVLLQV